MILALPLLLGAAPWTPPTDVPACGTGGPSALAVAQQVAHPTPPPPGVKQLPQQWSISRMGDIVVMRDITGEQMASSGFDYSAMTDATYEFYEWFPDEFDFVTFLTNTDASRSMNALAFYSPLSNDIEGIGQSRYGSRSTVQGLLFMNAWQYWSRGDTYTSAVFGQELGHRWGAYVGYDTGDGPVYDTLGRDDAHWSYWMETSNSPMEGNAWEDNGDGSYLLDAEDDIAYSDLDLYLMGLIGKDEVEPFFVIRDPAGLDRSAADAPEYFSSGRDQTATGSTQRVTIDDVIRAEGERSPAVGEGQTSFRMAIVLVLGEDEVPSQGLADEVDRVRTRFEDTWEEDTRYLATLDATPGETQLPPFDPATLGEPAVVPELAW